MTPEQPSPPDLRPLGVGEVLDAAFRLLRQNLGLYVRLALTFLVPPALLTALYMHSQIVLIRENVIFVDNPDTYSGTVLLLGFIGRIAQLLAFGLLVHLSSRLYLNHRETMGSIFRASLGRLLSLVGLAILLGLYALAMIFVAALVGAPFGFIGALFVAGVVVAWLTFYSLSVPAFWYENIGAAKAVGRSSRLVSGRFWKVLGALAVGLVIVGVFGIGLGVLLISTVLQVEGKVAYVLMLNGFELVGNLISMVVIAPIMTVVYFDTRVRAEGLDMKLKLDAAPRDEPPPSVPW